MRSAWLALAIWLLAGGAAAQNAPPYKPGFPLDIPGQTADQAAPIGSQVLAADLGLTAGFRSLIFGIRSGRLYVVKRDGASVWSVASGWPQSLPAHIYSSPAVGDLNADTLPDIVVGYGSTIDNVDGSPNHGGLRAYNRGGALLWEVLTGDITPGPADGFRDPVMSTPAIGDVDGDGTPEVVFGALDHKLYVVNGENGLSNDIAVWPMNMLDTVFSSPALHDVDGDGKLDIIIGTDSFSTSGGKLRVLRYNGTELPGFPKDIDQVVSSSPAVGDIDGDGQPEIVHGTGSFYPGRMERIYAWNCDGSAVAGWPVTTNGEVISSPVLANLDGDAALEVVATASNSGSSDGKFRLYAFNGNGGQIFSTVVCDFFNCQSLSAGEPVIADALGATSALEILVPTNGEVAIFDLAGNQLTETDNFPDDPSKPNLMTQDSLAAVAVTDLETNGSGSQIEVIAVSARDFPTQTTTVVHVWNPIARTSTPPWGFFHQNETRRGTAPGTPSCGIDPGCIPDSTAASFFTLTPCRLVDTRAGQAPALSSNVTRVFQVTGNCGVQAGASAISVNMTALQSTNSGSVRFGTGSCANPPNWTTVFFPGGQIRSSNAILSLSATGSIAVQAVVAGGGTVHLTLDVNGYFP